MEKQKHRAFDFVNEVSPIDYLGCPCRPYMDTKIKVLALERKLEHLKNTRIIKVLVILLIFYGINVLKPV